VRTGGWGELEEGWGEGWAVGVVVDGREAVAFGEGDLGADGEEVVVQEKGELLDYAAEGGLLRGEVEAVAIGVAEGAEVVVLVDVLEVEAGGEGGEGFVKKGALAEGVDFHFLEGGIVDPHGVAVADGGAGAGSADFAAEAVGDAEVDEAFADDGLIEEMGGALLGEGGFEVGLFRVELAKLLQEGGALRRGELGGAGGQAGDEQGGAEEQQEGGEAGVAEA
jgi:hypothetical protein